MLTLMGKIDFMIFGLTLLFRNIFFHGAVGFRRRVPSHLPFQISGGTGGYRAERTGAVQLGAGTTFMELVHALEH